MTFLFLFILFVQYTLNKLNAVCPNTKKSQLGKYDLAF